MSADPGEPPPLAPEEFAKPAQAKHDAASFGCLLACLAVLLLFLSVVGLCGAGSVQAGLVFFAGAVMLIVVAAIIGLVRLVSR